MDARYDPLKVESGWYSWWEDGGLFKPAAAIGSERFSMVLPPPNVTGALHIGHALTVAIQDAMVRYQRMRGKDVVWVPGLDHAGIATQSVVERDLYAASGGREDRHTLGRDAFVRRVWDWKSRYGGRINEQLRRVGASLDWSREAFTMDEQRSRAVVSAFLSLTDKGLLYRRNRLVNWCPHLQTAISDVEVDTLQLTGPTTLTLPSKSGPVKCELGVIDTFSYPLEGDAGVINVSTTRLETMVGDVAIAVHPDDPRYSHLGGKYAVHPINGRRIPIIFDAVLVDPTLGTGAVKVTPAHDPNDFECGIRHSLQQVNVLTDDGRMNSEGGPFEGQSRFQARASIRGFLTQKGLYAGKAPNPMSLNICSRSGDVLEPLLKPQWYVRCRGKLAETAIENVKSGKMILKPDGQQGIWNHWLTDTEDWCVSRQLWWGHRIPAYFIPAACSSPVLLARASGLSTSAPSRVFVHDGVVWAIAPDAASAASEIRQALGSDTVVESALSHLSQDEDVLDTWFSSALFPLTVFGWPDVPSPDVARYYPLDVMETGQDILFFWVARMAMLCTELSGEPPFKEVWLHPIVRDAQGKKMSKSTGNVVDPMDVIAGTAVVSQPCGADALRITLASHVHCSPGLQIHLDANRAEHYLQFCNKLWNASRFVLLHLGDPKAGASGPFGIGTIPLPSVSPLSLSLADAWLLSRVAATAALCDEGMTSFNLGAAVQALHKLAVNDFCDVYIEWCKMDLAGSGSDSVACRATLSFALDAILRLAHPFMPYLTEELWQRLHRPSCFDGVFIDPHDSTLSVSIMTSRIPSAEEWRTLLNPKAEGEMETVIDVLRVSRALIGSALSMLPDVKRKSISVKLCTSSSVEASLLTSVVDHMQYIARAGAFSVIQDSGPVPERSISSTASPTCTVVVILPDDGASPEKVRAAIARYEAKAGKLSASVKDMEAIADKLAASPKSSPQARERHATRLELERSELATVREVLGKLASLLPSK